MSAEFQAELNNLRRIKQLEAHFSSLGKQDIVLQEPPLVSLSDKNWDAAKAGLAGLAAFPGLAVDAVNWPLKKMGIGAERPFGGSDQLYEGASSALGVKNYPPENDQERYSMGIARAAGAGAPIILPLAVAAGMAGGVPAGLGALGLGALSTVGTGVGSEFGGELASELGGEGARPYGEMAGGLIGGQSPYTAAGLASKVATKTSRLISSDAQKAQAANAASAKLGGYIKETPNLNENIALAEEVSTKIPAFSATLAGRTQSPGIASISRHLEATDPVVLNTALQREQKNESAIRDFNEKALGGPGSVTAPATKILDQAMTKVDRRIKEIDALEAQLSEKFPRGEQKIVGEGLIKLRDERARLVKKKAGMLYEDLYATADAAKLKVPLPGLVTGIRGEIKKEKYQQQNIPEVFHKVLEKSGGKGDYTPTFREFHSLVKETGRELGLARQGTDARKIARLEKMYGGLMDQLKKYEDTSFGEIGQKLTSANKFYREKYQEVFKEGVGGLMKRENRWGVTTPQEDIVRNLIFKPNNAEGVEEFFRIYGDDPATRGEAFKLLRDGVLDIFSRDVVKKGVVNKAAVETFTKKYKQSLDRLPGIRDEIQDANRVTEVLLKRRAEAEATKKELSASWVADIAKTTEDKVPGLINKALSDKNTLLRLSNLANKSPNDKKAIVYEIANHINSKPDPYAYFKEKQDYLTPLLGKEHVENLRVLAGARTIQNIERPANKLGVKTTQEDIAKEKTGSSFTDITARYRAMAEGRTGAAHFIGTLASKYGLKIKEKQLRELYKQAIYDPDIAKTLAQMSVSKEVPKEVFFKLKAHLFGLGIRVGSELTDKDLPDDEGKEGE